MNKHYKRTIYIASSEDDKLWEEAKRIFPFALNMSVSQFVAAQVSAKVIELKKNSRMLRVSYGK